MHTALGLPNRTRDTARYYGDTDSVGQISRRLAQQTVSVAAALFLRAVPLRVKRVGRDGHRHGTERVGRVQGEIKDQTETRSIFELGTVENRYLLKETVPDVPIFMILSCIPCAYEIRDYFTTVLNRKSYCVSSPRVREHSTATCILHASSLEMYCSTSVKIQ